MPDWLTTHRSRPWHHVGHRVLRPFADAEGKDRLGEERKVGYCLRCMEYGTGQREGRFEGSVYAFKEWCRRCGSILQFGVYNQSGDASAAERARQWATTRERIG